MRGIGSERHTERAWNALSERKLLGSRPVPFAQDFTKRHGLGAR